MGVRFEAYKMKHAPMEWEDWECLSFILAHALSDVSCHGRIRKSQLPAFDRAIVWANSFHGFQKAPTYTWEHIKENGFQGSRILRKKEGVSCLDQDIFTAIFTIHTMTSGLFQLEDTDDRILDDILPILEHLVPWFKWID